jgi:hypothetical protein
MDHPSVGRGAPSVRPHAVLVIAITRPSDMRRRPEAERCRYPAQGLRGERPTKREQYASLIDIGLPRQIT